MSQSLIAQIKKARQRRVEVGGFTFIVRRPTDTEFVAHYELRIYEIAQEYVVGWEGVTEADIVNGGGEDAVPFDADLWREWCADRPDLWEAIFTAVLQAYEQHVEQRQAAVKN